MDSKLDQSQESFEACLCRLKRELQEVPQEPGCYLWKDASGEVLYVGKAKQLRSRMRQYVLGQDEREKIPLMMKQVKSFDYVVVSSEHESLVLEKNLIQQYKPPYNVDYRDDKSYPFIALTMGDLYPAIKYTREKHKAHTRYFGPYTDARAAREILDIARRVVPLCSANCSEWKRLNRAYENTKLSQEAFLKDLQEHAKPCFDYHVGKGPGACIAALSPQEYQEYVQDISRFLSGKRKEFIDKIRSEMLEAASNLEFEKAARARNRLATIEGLQDKQQVVLSQAQDIDLIGICREETIAAAQVFVVREGRVIISNEFILNKGMDVTENELIEAFLKRYYHDSTDIPEEILVPLELEDRELLEAWLSEKRTKRCRILRPSRGDKFKLRALADKNAAHALLRFKVRTRYDDERSNMALLQLENALALKAAPMRIECFDVSTIHGKHSVASMVVFSKGRPDKGQYRRFKIRMQTDEANDFAMMSEVLSRRYAPEKMSDANFGSKPDLLIVDGGKPQLSAAIKVLRSLGLDIPVCGLAKADEELFVEWSMDSPVVLPNGSASLYLVKHIRDEAHRFAITFHRQLRDKAMTASILDEIPGLGPKRKKSLLKHFGSFKKLKAAQLDEIKEAPGIPQGLAEDIFEYLSASSLNN